jgi:uncharacterized membrane protein
MVRKWLGPICLLIGFIIVLFLFPDRGLAVEYSITNVKIDAFLQENGQVEVKETFTYSFDVEFNGITRELIPKEGSKITQLKASEDGKKLRVEKEDHLYKIHRKGTDETIIVKLTYKIKNGVDVYSDLGEFYWPFFDDRNESTYENLTITIHPPKPANNVIAFGYDEAFEKEKMNDDGIVVFHMGEVPAGVNGDIRVAYESGLFPGAPNRADVPIGKKLLNERQELLDDAAETAAAQEKLSTIANVGIPVLSVILFLLIVSTWMRARFNRMAVEQESSESFSIPKEEMSLPATICYTNGGLLLPGTMAAALMDLVRKGFVQKSENDQFIVSSTQISQQKTAEHEQILIEFLFDEIGEEGKFSFEDLKDYTRSKNNHSKYQSNFLRWSKAVRKEMKEQELYENRSLYRWLVGLSSLVLLPFLFLFLAYGLFGWLMAGIVLFFTVIIYAIAYRPKTWKGLKVTHEWKLVRKYLPQLDINEWKVLTEDEKMRGYIYGLGIKDRNIIKNSKKLIKAFQLPETEYRANSADFYMIAYYGSMASTHFYSANERTSPSDSSSSSSVGSSGGGVGGGGGGSGAF